MKKKLLTIIISIALITTNFVNVVYAQSYNITISCDSDQGYFTYNSETIPNPSVIQAEKDNLYYYRELNGGQYSKLWVYDSSSWLNQNLVFFAVATPKEGYDFDNWYIGETEIGAGYTTANVNDNVVAKFVSYTKKVSGTVLDEDSNPVAGAEVKFESNDLYKYYTTTTDSDGKWSIDAKKNGTYTLKIKKSGFAQFEENNIAFGDTDTDLGSRQLTKLQLTYSTNGNGTLVYDKTGDTITLTANPADGYKLAYYDINLDPSDYSFFDNVLYNGKSLKFSMPNYSDIDVVGYFAQYANDASISFEIPAPGDTTFSNPTVSNDKLMIESADVYVYDMEEIINNDNWDTPSEFVEGGHYMVEFAVYARDGYVFKYKNEEDEYQNYYSYSQDYYGYDVELTINGTQVPIFVDDDDYDSAYESIGKSGFYGYDTSLWISYQFTVSDAKPTFENTEYSIKDDFAGTLEFVVDKSYNTDDGSDVTVKVDDVIVDPSNYDLAKASTHVTLHNDFIKTLSIGKHYLTIGIEGYSEATQKFTINSSKPTPSPNKKTKYSIPNTGVDGTYSDNHSLLKLSSLSLLAIGTYMAIKKKKDN